VTDRDVPWGSIRHAAETFDAPDPEPSSNRARGGTMKITIKARADHEDSDPEHSSGLNNETYDRVMVALFHAGLSDIEIDRDLDDE
jgi:hypothetical protein